MPFSAIPLSSCFQSFPASRSFTMSQLFTPSGQSIWASASASVLPMNIHDWFPLGLTGWISLQSNGLLRVFSNTTFQKHQFFSAQPSLWSNSHICTWLLEKLLLWLYGLLLTKWCLCFFNMLSRFVIAFLSRTKCLFYFVAAVTICSDFGAQENKICHSFYCLPIYLPWSDGTRCRDLHVLNVEF